jgi:hypothetical protein
MMLLYVGLATAEGAPPHNQIPAPSPQAGEISGTVVDVNGDAVSGATVVLDTPPQVHLTVRANDSGFFEFRNLAPALPYQATVSAVGFAGWTSPPVTLKPGQFLTLPDVRLQVAAVTDSVTAVYSTPEQMATEQVELAETQRVLGVLPNFYVVYNSADAVALTPKLKFRLALKTTFDPVTMAAIGLMAGINQAADRPDYVQGMKGYGQRLGSGAAIGATNIMVGGALLPTLLHQDPRYFYQGTGTVKSRMFHALSTPILCRGDNGKTQPNYSSVGGDLVSGALSESFYPDANRGPGLVFDNALINAGGRMVNGLLQEFVLPHFTRKHAAN